MCDNSYPSSFPSSRAKAMGAYSAAAVGMTETIDIYRSEDHRHENVLVDDVTYHYHYTIDSNEG